MKTNRTFRNYSIRQGRLVTPTLERTRSFDLQVAIPPYTDLVVDVLNSIENDRLVVVDEASSTALDDAMSGGQEINLSAAFTKPASIRHWLAAGCQVIRWDIGDEIGEEERKCGVMAMYQQNAAQVLFPVGTTHRPAGPAAFLGEIIVNASSFPPGEVSVKAKSFQFVIAHELTHVFDMLRLLIPAMKGWPKFWRNVLDEGQCCESARSFKVMQAAFVDDYGSENELATVKEYWPSRAEEWFAASRRK